MARIISVFIELDHSDGLWIMSFDDTLIVSDILILCKSIFCGTCMLRLKTYVLSTEVCTHLYLNSSQPIPVSQENSQLLKVFHR